MKNEERKKNRIQSFTDLNAWKEGHQLVLKIYEITNNKLPEEEKYALTSQMRRGVVSITSNIAEGFSRRSVSDKKHFYVMAQGSLTELQNQLLVARDLGYIHKEVFNDISEETVVVHKLLTGLIKATPKMKS